MAITVDASYAPVLFWLVAIAFEILVIGFVFVGGARKATKLPYPDMGTGRDSVKLTQEQYLKINNAQRVHYNFIEGAATILVALAVAGLYQPALSANLGAVYFVGRLIYSIGYTQSGAKGRLVGVLVLDVALFGLVGIALYNTFRAAYM